MTQALRYALVGILCATLVSLTQPAWWVIAIAFWAGTVLGFVGSLAVGMFDFAVKEKE